MTNATLIVEVQRAGLIESVHLVAAAVVGADDVLVPQAGSLCAEMPVFWRSAAKPFQALAVIESGAAEGFGLSGPELALCCASHSGAPEHVAAAASILRKVGARPDQLHCAAMVPFGEREAAQLQRSGQPPTRLHHNCSGKHAGMLGVCRAMRWPIDGYQRADHPLQRHLLHIMSQVTGVPVSGIGTAVDGCGVVVFRTPLSGMARAFARFALGDLPRPHRQAGVVLREAIRAAPLMLAGEGRLGVALVEVTGGRVLAKIGAEGVYGACASAAADGGPGGGLALKVLDGGMRAVGPALCRLCRELGWLSDEEMERLRRFWEVPQRNHQGDPIGVMGARRAPAGAPTSWT